MLQDEVGTCMRVGWGAASSPGGSQPRGIGPVYVLLSSTVNY